MGSNPIGGFKQPVCVHLISSHLDRHPADSSQDCLKGSKRMISRVFRCCSSIWRKSWPSMAKTEMAQAILEEHNQQPLQADEESVRRAVLKEFISGLYGLNTIVYIYPVYKGSWEILEYGVHN
jgi:hypothetical protein